jgi:hypothetical protein
MTLAAYVASVTHVEHLMWLEWLSRKPNEPDVYCWYLAQVAAEIRLARHSLGKGGRPVRLKDLILKFVPRDRNGAEEMSEEEAKRIEAAWMARMGIVGGGQRQPGQAGAAKSRGTPVRPLAQPPKGNRGSPPVPTQPRRKGEPRQRG